MKIKILYLLFVITLFSSCSKEEKVISLKENIHHDDFEYSVQSVEKADSIGAIKAKGTFYIVTFRVENKAKRVNHEWENSIAYIVGKDGKEYENSNDLQNDLAKIKLFVPKVKHNTPAGETESAILVFDVPKELKEPFLKVRGSFLMGDMFDGNRFKNTKVKLF
jgi:hypothetical protein